MRPRLFPLASFELAWTDAAFDAIYPAPPRSALPHGVGSMHPSRFFDDMLASIPLEQSLGLRVTLWMIALAPLFTIGSLGTIASIDAGQRGRVLERLLASPVYVVRQLAMSFKAVATLLYAKSDAVREAMTMPVRRTAASAASAAIAASAAAAEVLAAAGAEPGLVSAARLTSRGRAVVAQVANPSGESHDDAAA